VRYYQTAKLFTTGTKDMVFELTTYPCLQFSAAWKLGINLLLCPQVASRGRYTGRRLPERGLT